MPRPRRTPDQPNSIVASASAVTQSRIRPLSGSKAKDWQQEAWYFLDTVGELRFSVNYIASAMSRLRLKIVRDSPTDGEVDVTPDDTTPGAQLALLALESLCGGETGQSQMLKAFTTHLGVPGEGYLVGFPQDEEHPRDRWEVLSTVECFKENGRWVIDRGDEDDREEFAAEGPDAPLVIRIWNPHPRRRVEADSPIRAALPILRELEELTKHVAANIDSRLAGAGVLLIPSELTFGAPEPDPASGIILDPTADPFVAALTEAMVTARTDRGNASAVVPIVARAPGQYIANVKHVTFSTPFDAQTMGLREEAIRRLALALDHDPSILLGKAESNHWSGWLIDEDTLKIHIAPKAETLCHALTERFLWPVMEGRTEPDPVLGVDPEAINADAQPQTTVFRITYDDTELRNRPDQSSSATEAYDRMALSRDVYLAAHGFDPGDAPDEDELRTRLILNAARANVAPEVAVAAMTMLGVAGLPDPASVSSSPGDSGGAGPTVAPSPEDNRALPEQQAAALQAAAELILGRTIERARNRLGRRTGTVRGYPAAKVAEALTSEPMDCARVSALLGVEAPKLHGALMGYAQMCLIDGRDLDPVEVGTVLRTVLAPPLRAVTSG